ncbi:hypothetical protein KIN20_002504 [Parelaphostrongylus tenuis]|uniref:Beta-lactamase-related domain-containing protein n=1 Tax=Parelaphostrongylus tenuis TaxID=148309 RepID=A0AAD5LXV4_PARTN|nr:hypothetical protein KIN20_002504 [Parelaphostrongylus tenuis]
MNATALLEYYIQAYKPVSQPGKRYLYSNIGYIVLGKIVEQVTLRPYEEFIQDIVLKPNHIEARIGDEEPSKSEVTIPIHRNDEDATFTRVKEITNRQHCMTQPNLSSTFRENEQHIRDSKGFWHWHLSSSFD